MPLLGRIEALERAMRAGHSSATHDTPSVTNFGHGTRRMQNPNPDLSITGATGTTHSPTARLDLTELDSLVHFYFGVDLATSTRKTYEVRRRKLSAQSSTYTTSKPANALLLHHLPC